MKTDKNGKEYKIGDLVQTKWNYQLRVGLHNGELVGWLVCKPGHPCEHIPYFLNSDDEIIEE